MFVSAVIAQCYVFNGTNKCLSSLMFGVKTVDDGELWRW